MVRLITVLIVSIGCVSSLSAQYCIPNQSTSSQVYISRVQMNEQGGGQIFGWNSGNEGYVDRTQYSVSGERMRFTNRGRLLIPA